MRYLIFLALCSMLIMPALVTAQEEDEIAPLSETYIAKDETFSFSYPKDWEITLEGSNVVTFSVPLASTGEPNQEGIGIESQGMSITVSLDEESGDLTAEDLVLEKAETLAVGDAFEITEVENNVVNGRPTAFVAVVGTFLPISNGFYTIDLADDDNLFLNFWFAGTDDQIRRIFPVVSRMFGTLRVPANAEPIAATDENETYHVEDWQLSFDYPAGWTVDEQPTYVLITAPNGVTLGISAAPPSRGEPTDLETLVIERVEAFMQTLSENVGSPVELPIDTSEIDNQPAARVDYQDGNFQYTFVSIVINPDLIATMTVIGDTSSITDLESNIKMMLISLRVLDSDTSAVSSSDDLLTYTEPNQLVEFDYPAAWELVEEEGFTKLRLPGEMVIDLLVLPFDVTRFGDDPIYGFGLSLLERMQQDVPSLTENDIERITIGDFEGVQLSAEIPADGISVRNIALDLGKIAQQRPNERVFALIIMAGDTPTFDADAEAIMRFLKSLRFVE